MVSHPVQLSHGWWVPAEVAFVEHISGLILLIWSGQTPCFFLKYVSMIYIYIYIHDEDVEVISVDSLDIGTL